MINHKVKFKFRSSYHGEVFSMHVAKKFHTVKNSTIDNMVSDSTVSSLDEMLHCKKRKGIVWSIFGIPAALHLLQIIDSRVYSAHALHTTSLIIWKEVIWVDNRNTLCLMKSRKRAATSITNMAIDHVYIASEYTRLIYQ